MHAETDRPTAFPLTWPIGWKRTEARDRKTAQFHTTTRQHSSAGNYTYRLKRPMSVSEALKRLDGEISAYNLRGRTPRIDLDRAVVSTNLALRLDGLPRSDQREPVDPGAALYFTFDRKPCVIACDKWTRVADNITAIAAHLEALRGQERWGCGSLERAFTGYQALPAPAAAGEWWTVLGVSPNASLDQVREAWRARITNNHPDHGGNLDEAARVNAAWAEAKKHFGAA
jgi:hypothetical protein